MDNALGQPQTIVVLGGTSDIGLAISRELLSAATRAVVLAARDVEKGEVCAKGLRRNGLDVVVERFDGDDVASHADFAERITSSPSPNMIRSIRSTGR